MKVKLYKSIFKEDSHGIEKKEIESIANRFGFSVSSMYDNDIFLSSNGEISLQKEYLEGKKLVQVLKTKYKNMTTDIDIMDNYVSIEMIYKNPEYIAEKGYVKILPSIEQYLTDFVESLPTVHNVFRVKTGAKVQYFGKIQYITIIEFDFIDKVKGMQKLKTSLPMFQSKLSSKFNLSQYYVEGLDYGYSVKWDVGFRPKIIISSPFLSNR